MASKKNQKKIEDDLKKMKKNEDDQKKNGKQPLKKINLIGCDTIVNSPSYCFDELFAQVWNPTRETNWVM